MMRRAMAPAFGSTDPSIPSMKSAMRSRVSGNRIAMGNAAS
jgi:hypothetical protein